MEENERSSPQEATSPINQPGQAAQPPVVQQSVQPAVVGNNNQETFQEKPGGIRFRIAANFFDSLIISVPMSFLFSLVLLVSVTSNLYLNIVLLVVYAVYALGYFIYFDVKKGATPGKSIYGMKVVNSETKNNLSLKEASIREIVNRGFSAIPFIGLFFMFINFIVLISKPHRRGIHDKFAKSQVLVVKKPWSLLKQLGLFIVLLVITSVPYIFNLSKANKESDELRRCVLECIDTKRNEGLSELQMKEEAGLCPEICSQNIK